MKKAGVLLITLLFALCVPFTVLAGVSSVEYEDEKTGTTFIVPAGWSELDGEDIGVNADFTFVHDETLDEEKEAKEQEKEEKSKKKKSSDDELFIPYITYRSEDLYSSLPEGKTAKSREEVNLDFFTVSELADYLGIKETKLSKATYNRVDYYRFTSKAKKFTKSLKKEQRVTGYITVKNGWAYTIILFDSTNSPVYDDFKTLMGSVIIEGKTPEKPKREKLITPKKIVLIAVMLASVGGFVFIVIKTKKK